MRRKEVFDFKQFSIHQEHAAMKVGTDGVLLGRLAAGGKRILDIGTGTGILSLMLAQRFPEAEITAIDIDDNAIKDARVNFENSPFYRRITLKQCDFTEYSSIKPKTSNLKPQTYDSIVCNPPYFDESLENPDESRTRARHTSSLSFRNLIGGAYTLLDDNGVFSVCIPPEVLKKFSAETLFAGFTLKELWAIKSVPRKPEPKRYVLIYQKCAHINDVEEHFVCLQNSDGTRSEWYQDIMQDFYL